ncbi:hypothetical protein [Streptomyces vinaceus]
MLNWLVLSPIDAELTAQPAAEVERLLVPVVAGAFHGYRNPA